MKLHHFSIVFVIIMIAIVVITDIRTNNLTVVIENKVQLDKKIDSAIDDAITRLTEVDESNHIIINKEAAVSSFFISLNSVFGVLEDKAAQEKLNLYVPVIAITAPDGYYIFYSDQYNGADGYTYISKGWSENIPYYYEDEDFIYRFSLGDIVTLYDKNNILNQYVSQEVHTLDYHDVQKEEAFAAFREQHPESILLDDESFELVRKAAIIRCLEESMAFYTSRHNMIAQQYGITYNFSLPAVSNGAWVPYLDDISMFVVFQGYPYGNDQGETYNRIATAGAKIAKKRVYYIEQKGWYLIYHKADCQELKREGIILWEEPEFNPLSCAKKGCYQCPICFKNGIHPPEYIQ